MLPQFIRHRDSRDLVSIRRSGIDPNSIQAFVLGVSKELIALQYVYDFNLDGIMLLRLRDVSDVRCSATCKFQKRLLRQEGLIDRVPFGLSLDLINWKASLTKLSRSFEYMILEGELLDPREFLIGKLLRTTSRSATMKCFTGTGKWQEPAVTISFDDITACQVANNYIQFYERYFQRTAT